MSITWPIFAHRHLTLVSPALQFGSTIGPLLRSPAHGVHGLLRLVPTSARIGRRTSRIKPHRVALHIPSRRASSPHASRSRPSDARAGWIGCTRSSTTGIASSPGLMDDRVRLYTRRGFNWADRYPRIVEALRSLRVRSIVIDGEAVICGTDGKSDFDKLHSGANDASVCLYGFDLLELDGEDLRPASLRAPQEQARKAARAERRHSLLRASRRRRRDHLCARLQARAGRHRLEAARPPVPLRPMQRVEENQKCAAANPRPSA
jgi:hypothetical protein